MKNRDMLEAIIKTHRLDLTRGSCGSVFDTDGLRWLDFNQICTVLGQNNARFIKRMTEALNGVTSNKAGFHPYKEQLQKYLMDTTGGDFSYIHMTASGSEATEWAVRLALKMTKRTETLSFWNSIHGRTYLSASMSGFTTRKTYYGPLAPGVLLASYPHCFHCPYEKKPRECEGFCLRFLDQKLKYESANDVGAVIVEPIQGSGVIIPPRGWLRGLQDWAHRRGALFILDEVQTGMGRTGPIYRYREEGLSPDMLILGKSIANGLHMGVILSKKIPDEEYLYALTGGAGDDPLACAAACAVFEELFEGGLLEHIKRHSMILTERLKVMAERHPVSIVDVRQAGLFAAIELESLQLRSQLMPLLREERLFVGTAENATIMLKPPLTVTEEELWLMASKIGSCLSELDKKTIMG